MQLREIRPQRSSVVISCDARAVSKRPSRKKQIAKRFAPVLPIDRDVIGFRVPRSLTSRPVGGAFVKVLSFLGRLGCVIVEVEVLTYQF